MTIDRHSRHRGIALIVTLAMLVILTILVVGFVSSTGTERQASASMAEHQRAKLLAQSALDHAVAILDKNIPQPAAPAASPYPLPPAPAPPPSEPPVNWVVNPGRLAKQTGTNAPEYIPLSSNPNMSYVATATDANLNPPLLNGSGNLVLPTNAPMRVAWVPVLRDPTLAASAANPIVGRYGFWIDDENARVNLNTAYGKGSTNSAAPPPQVVPGTVTVSSATYPIGHPTSINLETLDPQLDRSSLATSTLRSEASLGHMTSIAQGRQFFSSPAAFNANKFFLTTSSIAPEFNVFGKSRLYFGRYVSTGLVAQLNQFPFDWESPSYFGRDENKAPTAGADSFSLYRTAAVISNQLARSDWPGMPSSSFVDKWGGGLIGQREADQVAWNIVALGGYGNVDTPLNAANAEAGVFAEYQNVLASGAGATGSTSLPNSAIPVGRLSQKAVMPALPKPGIQEIALVVTPMPATAPAGRAHVKLALRCEFKNGDRFPTSNKSGLGFYLTHFAYNIEDEALPTDAAAQSETAYFQPAPQSPIYSGVSALYGFHPTGAVSEFSPGAFLVVSTANNRSVFAKNGSGKLNTAQAGSQTFSSIATVRVRAQLRLASKYSGSGLKMPIQVIPVWDSRDPAAAAALQSPASSDKDTIDFDFTVDLAAGEVVQSVEVAAPQLAGRAESWSAVSSPPGATETLGLQNNASTGAGDLTKLNAYSDLNVGSYTGSRKPSIGMLSLVPTGMQRGLVTTLKFQPSGSASQLPDWLLLDLLAPSVGSPVSQNNSTRGRINANAAIFPTGGATFAPPARELPLQAVFANMSSSASTVAANIVNHTNASSGVDFGIPGAFDYVGEICEIAGVADAGANDWQREFLVRNLSGLITTQSNAFRVIGVAQALKKKPGSVSYGVYEAGDVVTGETRFESVVQRYFWQGRDEHAGNAHVDEDTGKYDRLSSTPGWTTGGTGQSGPFSSPDYNTSGKWEQMDGPDAPTYSPQPTWGKLDYTTPPGLPFQTSLENAENPLRALAKFRTIYFNYFNE